MAHDPDAFEDFYRTHIEAVQGFIVRRVADPYLAADLTADVFLAAIDSADSYRPNRGAPIGWLFGIARNVVAAEHRRSVDRDGGVAFTIDPPASRGQTLVITSQTLPTDSGATLDGAALGIEYVKGKAHPCKVVDAPE